jgi:hypothetical protein
MIYSFLKSGKGKFLSFGFLSILFTFIAFTSIFIIDKNLFYEICYIAAFIVTVFLPHLSTNPEKLMIYKGLIFFYLLFFLWSLYLGYIRNISILNNPLLFLKNYSKLIFIRKLIFQTLIRSIFLPILMVIFFYSLFLIPIILSFEFYFYLNWYNLFLYSSMYISNLQINLNHFVLIQMDFENLEQLQTWVVDYALHSMRINEFLFEYDPNTTSFQNYKIFYKQNLKFFFERLDLETFKNPDEALRLISAAYEHYFKIIEFNKDSTISQITNK